MPGSGASSVPSVADGVALSGPTACDPHADSPCMAPLLLSVGAAAPRLGGAWASPDPGV